MPGDLTRARRRLVLIASTTLLAIAGLGATAAPSMADFRVATTTTVTASPSVVDPSGSTTLTASILPGFLIGPLGNVKFTDSNNGAVLGTIKPKLQCILRKEPCIATLTVQASVLAAGDNTIVAAYSGGIATKPSSGSTDVLVGTQNTCAGSGQCNTSATSSDGSTSTTISSPPPSSGTETVQAFFTTQTLSCTKVGFGDTLVYTVTNPGAGIKTVTLTLTGSAADQEHQLDPQSLGNVCFGSTSPFETSTAARRSRGPTASTTATCRSATTRTATTTAPRSSGNIVVSAGTYPCINYVNAQQDTWASYAAGSSRTARRRTPVLHHDGQRPETHG